MSILIDQCVPRKYLRILIEWGYQTSLVQQHIRADSPDPDVIKLAQTLDAVLLTVDLDFANIIDYPPQYYGGIVVMKYEIANDLPVTATLKQVLADLHRDKLRRILVIVDANRYRIRRGE